MAQLITIDRAEAKAALEQMFENYADGLAKPVTEQHIDLFIEYVETYGMSERMVGDYMDEVQ